ncbi:MAG TPA: hypothetical protein VD993_07210 [Chitinophagaceae bacterium]|nr:hypothetical protein [Chitinophagaceae bacterium]
MEENKNQNTGSGQQGNQNWDDKNDQRSGASRQPNPERLDTEETQSGQEGNQNWDDQNDKGSGTTHKPNPERYEGSAFNESQPTSGYGSSQRGDEKNVGPLDADLNDKTSEKRSGNQTGPGLG